ncbi:inactive ribonuclease-like protein 9 [Ursus americanus]|uniref:Inactive ribonuclease-like protein 9 n=1 Tax=Ursus maritimus TaxID=29073 RepID=A0A384BH57_URSMA|nr:inactive ribonuclease-like protein 9 [Ursus maritimus]XP_026346341.1 inactive ribonuclease-like protein 9 [Ursus arctos]XP_045640879.1 inactive ribonuclease-like protein 9 [Ursus americanus]
MRAPRAARPLALLLLLLQPLQFEFLRIHLGKSEEETEEFEDYLEELLKLGPARPLTKDAFRRRTIIDPARPLTDPEYCTAEMKMKNVHDKFRCVREHFFLQVVYEELQKLCKNIFVPCKNGVKKCHRSRQLIEGVYCNLTRGARMSDCEYKSSYRQGYVLITCRWQDDIQEIIPAYVNDIMTLDKHVKDGSIFYSELEWPF